MFAPSQGALRAGGHSMLCPYEEKGEEPIGRFAFAGTAIKESLVRRLVVFCVVAGAFLAAYAVAQNNSAALRSPTLAAGLPANARVIANGIAVRALAANPSAALSANAAEVLNVTLADSPNRVFELAIPATMGTPVHGQSKRDSSTACAGVSANDANTKSMGPAHFARNDDIASCAANMARSLA